MRRRQILRIKSITNKKNRPKTLSYWYRTDVTTQSNENKKVKKKTRLDFAERTHGHNHGPVGRKTTYWIVISTGWYCLTAITLQRDRVTVARSFFSSDEDGNNLNIFFLSLFLPFNPSTKAL